MALGGAISGEHGLGKEKKKYFLELEDPTKIELMRRIKSAFDPNGHPQPRHDLRLTREEIADERRPVADPHARRLRRRHLLHQPRHLGDALRRRARRGARDARRARALRRRRDGRGRRLRAHGGSPRLARCCTSARASATGSRTSTTPARARVPIVNIVGDHATYHARYDAQLQSDIETVARNVSSWIRTSQRPEDAGADAAEAVAAALGPPGQVATLILPADVCWLDGGVVAKPKPTPTRARGRRRASSQRSRSCCAPASRPRSSSAAPRCASAASSRRAASRTRPARSCSARPSRRDSSAAPASRRSRASPISPSSPRAARGLRHLVLVDAKSPVSFFAYPGKASDLVPEGCTVHVLATGGQDAASALEALADRVGATQDAATLQPAARPALADRRPQRRRRRAARSARCCPKARSSPTKPTRRA